MKKIGIRRKVDELGRIVLPKELRTLFEICEKDPVEIYVDKEFIIVKKANLNPEGTTGIVRHVDELGRVVLPIELRNMFSISPNDLLEISVIEDRMALVKYQMACVFCGSEEHLVDYMDKKICKVCVANIQKLV